MQKEIMEIFKNFEKKFYNEEVILGNTRYRKKTKDGKIIAFYDEKDKNFLIAYIEIGIEVLLKKNKGKMKEKLKECKEFLENECKNKGLKLEHLNLDFNKLYKIIEKYEI